ncbi:MAG: NAD(P)/FAD-dependent oxidoreductase [Leeuwenhoekiella sp.]
MKSYDAIIIGSGINGLSAAIYLQQQGLNTIIFESADTPGGSTKTEELTLPGFLHDTGSAIHPMAYASPFLKTLPLKEHGLEWIFPEIPYAHPFLDGTAIAAYADLDKTAAQLGIDAKSYRKIFDKIIDHWESLAPDLLGPLSFPKKPLRLAQFGLKALQAAKTLVNNYFTDEKTKAFFYGAAAHSTLPLDAVASSSFGLVLAAMAHKYNWPFPKGGAYKITEALVSYYQSLGGELVLNSPVSDLQSVPKGKCYLFDLTPKQLLKIQNTNLSDSYRKRLMTFKYGAGIFKMDWALSKPIPWRNEKCRKAGTVHLGFTTVEMERSEALAHMGSTVVHPYVLVAQHTLFDPSRAPARKHTAWAYCHVPNGNTEDLSEVIENEIERAAPGFTNTILARASKNTVQMEQFNPNIIGGDINGGKQDITQLFTRPVAKISPYTTSNPHIYLCSSSTPPGGGVHGMCGYHAAKKAFRDHFKK